MTYQPAPISDDLTTLPRLPGWVTSGRAETLETVAFRSGAALVHLHLVLGRNGVPQSLLRQRLALRAAEACVTQSGRPERARGDRQVVSRDRKCGCATFCHAAMVFAQSFQRSNAATRL